MVATTAIANIRICPAYDIPLSLLGTLLRTPNANAHLASRRPSGFSTSPYPTCYCMHYAIPECFDVLYCISPTMQQSTTVSSVTCTFIPNQGRYILCTRHRFSADVSRKPLPATPCQHPANPSRASSVNQSRSPRPSSAAPVPTKANSAKAKATATNVNIQLPQHDPAMAGATLQ
jgi:hypothetical protein